MGFICAPGNFQDKMYTLMKDLAFAHTYLDGLLCLIRCSFAEHLSDVEQVLVRLHNVNLKVNTTKSNSSKT